MATKDEVVVVQIKGTDVAEIKTGMVISTPGALTSVKLAEVSIDMSAEGGLTLPIKTNNSVQVVLYGQTEYASIIVGENKEIKPGDTGKATLKFSSPVAINTNTTFQLKIGGKTVGQGVFTRIIDPE
jgi:translation elongation factor EF-Tu-like GTPase